MTEQTIILPPNSGRNGHEANFRLTAMVPRRRFLSYLRERWWVVLATLVIFLGVVLTYETIRTPTYSSFAQLYLSGDAALNPTVGISAEESLNYFGTQIELLKSSRLQGAVYDRLGIAIKPDKKPPVEFSVVQPLKTSLLTMQATGADPALVQRFLQTLIDEYLAYKKETRLSSSEDLLISITEQVTRKDKDLQADQDKWAEFQRTNNVAVLEEEGKSAGLYLAELNLQLAKLRLEQKLLHQSADAKTNANDDGNFRPATESISNPLTTNQISNADDTSLRSARVELAVLLGDKTEKVRYFGEQKFEQEVTRLRRLISILEEEYRSRKSQELEDIDRRIAAVETAIPSWETKVLDINERLAQTQRLKNNIQREQGYYDHLLGTLQNIDLNKNVQQERLSVLQPATAGTPEKRSLALRIVIAAIGGIAASLGLVFVWHLLDDRFVSARDIKDQFGEPMLGMVPQIKVQRGKHEQALLAPQDSRHNYVEAFRQLRSALLLSAPEKNGSQVLLFTSAIAAEGKTTMAMNLARVLARSGRRVALVNLTHDDSLMPASKTNALGVLDYLRGEVALETILIPLDGAGLDLVPRGTHEDERDGLFLSPRLAEFVRELRQDRDFVIFDSAPILTSDDTALLVPHADKVILVVRPFFTRSRVVRQALEMLYQRQARQVSLILNRARADDLAGYQHRRDLSNVNGKSRNGSASLNVF